MHSRRDFLKTAGIAGIVGPALLEESLLAAAQVRAATSAAPASAKLFDLEKLAEGVYAAIARPQFYLNSNACVIVNEDDVMVVDTHSKPSAARALISQIRRELTPKPVRYVVNTHFHADHAQGNHAYPKAFPGRVETVSSAPTRQLLAELGKPRLQRSLANVPKQLEDLRRRLAEAPDAQRKAHLRGLIAQVEAYRKEMRDLPIDLPTVTFDRSLVLRKKDREISLLFLGRGHTAGDVVVFLPKEKVVATGDVAHGLLPYIADGFPSEWPTTLDRLRELDFARVSPGHAGVQEGKALLGKFRDYIEELTALVRRGMGTGRTLEELQKQITPQSLRTLQTDGYLEALHANLARVFVTYPGAPAPLENSLASNIADVYKKLQA